MTPTQAPPGRCARFVFIVLATLFALLAVTRAAGAEEREAIVRLDLERLTEGVSLVGEWRYHPGDDPAWADPGLDDSDWPLVDPALKRPKAVPNGWPGIGWFRRRIVLAADVGDAALGLFMFQFGASEVWVDGRRVAEFGQPAATADEERAVCPQWVASVTLEPEVEHLLAVRFSNAAGSVLRGGFRGFTLSLGEMEALTARGILAIRQYSTLFAAAIGLFGAFALLYLLLFLFRTRRQENLLFALFNGATVCMLVSEAQMNSLTDISRVLFHLNWAVTFGLVMPLTAWLLELAVFRHRVGRAFYAATAAAAGVLVWTWTRPALTALWPFAAFALLIYLETVRRAVIAHLRGEPDAWLIAVGFLTLTLSVIVNLLEDLELVSVPRLLTFLIGFGVLALCFAVFLGRRVSRTAQELEVRLAEVEALTAKTIEQERRAAREEADRKVLETENRRKNEELEEARQLQLAMLPRELPRLGSYELAVHMSIASEVGGDYYDFGVDGDAAPTLAVGDATGHGLYAGMVVAVAKSIFQASCQDPDLSAVLRRIGRGLSGMHRRVASMAMLLARLEPRCLRVASAGMPPILVWRHDLKRVEEVLQSSLPLGTMDETTVSEREIELAVGDTALVMTDGLAEVADPEGRQLGYDGAARLFASAAGRSPQAIVDALVGATREFLAGAQLPDDLTLVVLEAR